MGEAGRWRGHLARGWGIGGRGMVTNGEGGDC